MIQGAGILFLAPGNRALFIKRSPGSTHPGEWCFPGGHVEEGETTEKAALREALEEIGRFPKHPVTLHTRSQVQDTVPVQEVAGAIPLAAAGAGEATLVPSPTPAPPLPETVDFSTFLMRTGDEFQVRDLSADEHVSWCWAPIDSPPEPLLPGCRVALERLAMNELDVARAIAEGRLTSPQRYENMSLFDIRITGTGTAYRKSIDEFVYRHPDNYMTEDFLARCNGLAVIMEHPRGATLTSKEWEDRAVGSVLLPYFSDGVRHPPNEVWAVAKVYDDAAIKMMTEKQLSTSPAVVFRDPDVNNKLELENGSKLLVEGKPSLLDHIAICERGVWDKGGEPNGVVVAPDRVALGDSEMADEDTKKDADETANLAKKEVAKADADAGDKLDQCLNHLDSFSKRMDALEEGEKKRMDAMRKDSEKEEKDEKKSDEFPEKDEKKADKKKDSKKDADEDEDEDEEEEPKKVVADKKKDEETMADKKADSELADVKASIKRVESMLPKVMTDAERDAMADAQSTADRVYAMYSDKAPRPLDGEDLNAYRRRLVKGMQPRSSTWKEVDMAGFNDSALAVAEKQIYADASAAALNPADLGAGQLRAIRHTDDTGRVHTRFAGQPRSWMQDFAPPTRRVTWIDRTSPL